MRRLFLRKCFAPPDHNPRMSARQVDESASGSLCSPRRNTRAPRILLSGNNPSGRLRTGDPEQVTTPQESLFDRIAQSLKRALVSLLQLRDSPESIAMGAAAGIFIGLTPTVGFQTILALAATIHWRINRTAALIAIFVSNPFTTVPVYSIDYIIGKAVLRNGPQVRELIDALRLSDDLPGRIAVLIQFGWPLMLGGIIVGIVVAVPTYFIVLSLIRNERKVLGVDLTLNIDRRLLARWRGKPLVLASASARREALLRDAGFWFDVITPDIDETFRPGIPPWRVAEELAEAKAREVARVHGKGVILGADTVVDLDGEILGKPANTDHARRMLEKLSGTQHRVITGVALVDAKTGDAQVDHASTAIRMKKFTDDEIDAYVASREGVGKAGGYALQESGDRFVENIDGSISNVIGLPMELVQKLLVHWETAHKTKLLTKLTRGVKS